MNIREFAQHKFDVLILLTVSLAMLLLVHQFAHHSTDARLTEWAMRAADMLLGALIMALTGSRGGFRRSDSNGANGNDKPEKPADRKPGE